MWRLLFLAYFIGFTLLVYLIGVSNEASGKRSEKEICTELESLEIKMKFLEYSGNFFSCIWQRSGLPLNPYNMSELEVPVDYKEVI